MKKFDFGFGEFLSFMTLTEVLEDGGEPSTSGERKLIPAKQVLSPTVTAAFVMKLQGCFVFVCLFVCFFPGHCLEHRSFVVP